MLTTKFVFIPCLNVLIHFILRKFKKKANKNASKRKHMYDDIIWKNDTAFEFIGSDNFGLFNMGHPSVYFEIIQQNKNQSQQNL